MRAILFHGSGSNPDLYWFPYIKHALEECGYEVIVPAFPDPEHPRLDAWLEVALCLQYDAETILIGHSSGATLILSVLERIQAKVAQAILVAGFFEPLNPPEPEPMVQSHYDWEKIRSSSAEFLFINSDNDPWGCNAEVGRRLKEKLGGQLVIPEGEGHMGSVTFNQPYKEFPLLLGFIQ